MNTKENIKKIIVKKPLKLDCGKTIENYPLAYETYGTLNKKKDNLYMNMKKLENKYIKIANECAEASGKIIKKFFRKKINFACWSDDKNVLSSLKKGLSNSQGCDSDIDSSLFQD